MAIPDFLSDTVNAPGDASDAAVTDVNTIIATVRANLVTAGNWTEPSTALFKSVVDSAGHFIDVLLTRIAATNLEWRVRDKNANVILTRRIQVTAGGVTVEYYWGNFHLVVCSRTATAEVAQAFLLDPTAIGDSLSAAPNRAVGGAYRSAADATDANSIAVGNYFAWDNGASAQFYRQEYRGSEGASATSTVLTVRSLVTSTGRLANVPANIFVNQSGTRKLTGALPCCLVVDSGQAFDAVRNGPLDGSITRKMIVLPLTSVNVNRLAIRKPSLDA